jgi:hypothetical protein
MTLFELEWLGGIAEHHFRKIRPGTDELPWGTLELGALPPALRDRARVMWTTMARNEYATAIHMTQLLQLLLVAHTPIDLVGMASDFVADEMRHVELCARVAMELGGGAPVDVDYTAMVRQFGPGLLPRQQASEAMIRVCCVGESFSLPMLAGAMKASTHPLTRGALATIVRDEAPHGRLGWLYLDWIAGELDAGEPPGPAAIATDSLRGFTPLWRPREAASTAPWIRELRQIGWIEPAPYRDAARRAALDDVVAPLAKHGIVVDVDRIEGLAGHSAV